MMASSFDSSFMAGSLGNIFGQAAQSDFNQQLHQLGMGHYIRSVAVDKPTLFGPGLEGAKRLVMYEEQVLGVTNHGLAVTEKVVYKVVPMSLHNCLLCWVATWWAKRRK